MMIKIVIINNQPQDLNNVQSEDPESFQNMEMDQNIENQDKELLLINLFLRQNQFAKLFAFIEINKAKLSQKLLSSYIICELDFYKYDINILNEFLSNGINLLM